MTLDRLSRSLGLFATLDPQLQLHFIRVFLYVAQHHSVTYAELEKAMDTTNSSISRTLNALGSRHRSGEKGLGLVEVFIDPDQGRRYRARLTKKGRALLQQLEILNSDVPATEAPLGVIDATPVEPVTQADIKAASLRS